ncbi:uncharacterized protein LOC133353539 [Lethenteron reissneri]|uniref:uncharacterized protein LOC133353539 n=1 Tax=Lethenteron reissneri TaxID=7753 RepID=UPI002AB6EB2B|nr:uncharacterized protein LOC133353539 [Lethenteron reissneri]
MDAILSQPSSASANPLLDEGLPTASSIPHGCSRTRTDRVAPTPQRLRSKRLVHTLRLDAKRCQGVMSAHYSAVEKGIADEQLRVFAPGDSAAAAAATADDDTAAADDGDQQHVPSGHVLSRLGVATGGVEESCHRCLLPLALVLLLVGAVVTALACHADGPSSVMGLFGVALMILAVFMLATGAISWCWRRGRGRAAPPEGRLGPARC